MGHEHVLEEARETGRPPETEVRTYDTKEDFERAGRAENSGAGASRPRKAAGKRPEKLLHAPAYEQEPDAHLDDLRG